jgi:arylsulfatase A-like enzyme
LARLELRGPPKPLVDRKRATLVTDEFLAWQQRDEDAPFFAFLNYFDAHDPYEPPEPYLTRFSTDPDDRMARYDGGIAYMDAELGRLTRHLAQRGILDRTILVVTSDHGEMFGEHGLYSHGHALYLELMHVPLVVRYPAAMPQGLRVDRPVALRDLARTLVELAKLRDTMPGRNFASEAWRTEPAPPDSVNPSPERTALFETERTRQSWVRGPAAEGPLHGLLDDRWHYILNPDSTEELFAYRTDRAEARNMAATPEGQSVAARYRALLPTLARRLVQ